MELPSAEQKIAHEPNTATRVYKYIKEACKGHGIKFVWPVNRVLFNEVAAMAKFTLQVPVVGAFDTGRKKHAKALSGSSEKEKGRNLGKLAMSFRRLVGELIATSTQNRVEYGTMYASCTMLPDAAATYSMVNGILVPMFAYEVLLVLKRAPNPDAVSQQVRERVAAELAADDWRTFFTNPMAHSTTPPVNKKNK